jgi:hypothetical protein
MQCPYCTKHFHFDHEDVVTEYSLVSRDRVGHIFAGSFCPACGGLFVAHYQGKGSNDSMSNPVVINPNFTDYVYPRRTVRKPAHVMVPTGYAEDYHEACLVLDESPKASAALSRRCLQSLLREHFGIKKTSLDKEIEELLASGKLPSYIADVVDAVRTVGNLAAHPTKDQHTGEIADVEPGEAEWLIEVLDSLFDFCFVQPAKQQEKKDALNAKLAALGKPALKS